MENLKENLWDTIRLILIAIAIAVLFSSCCSTYSTKSSRGLAPVCGKAKSYNR
tara:strand:- start:2972 stop:3130 length:159 start_codon:yes stop_codon:yes gene_type:complete